VNIVQEERMSAWIRQKKFGTKTRRFYRSVVLHRAAGRDARTLDEVGLYHPIEAAEKQILFDEVKVRSWLDKGATATDTVRSLFNKKGFYMKAAPAPQP
jgi:small subunit ribosomal protein S16